MQRSLIYGLFGRTGARHLCWSVAGSPYTSTISQFRRIHHSPTSNTPSTLDTLDTPINPIVDSPQIIFSGIQPTGVPHLGNYLGALKNWTKLQNESPKDTKLIFCLVDLHAVTLPQHPDLLRQWKRESLATLLAIGLDPEQCIIFEQSAVPAHTELMWLLSCNASMGMLNRMTQWKDKSKTESTVTEGTSAPALKLGLFSYPVLQAADILVHGATQVPVGADQAQHLELTRNLAISFNHHFGPTFPIPRTLLSPAKRIMSLQNPTSKMSKSGEPKSRISLNDPESAISSKIMSALTDSQLGISYDTSSRPGVSNLIEIYGHMTGRDDFNQLAEEFDKAGLGMRQLKEKVRDVVIEKLEPIRTEYDRVSKEHRLLDAVTGLGKIKAQENAEIILHRVKKAMGLL